MSSLAQGPSLSLSVPTWPLRRRASLQGCFQVPLTRWGQSTLKAAKPAQGVLPGVLSRPTSPSPPLWAVLGAHRGLGGIPSPYEVWAEGGQAPLVTPYLPLLLGGLSQSFYTLSQRFQKDHSL